MQCLLELVKDLPLTVGLVEKGHGHAAQLKKRQKTYGQDTLLAHKCVDGTRAVAGVDEDRATCAKLVTDNLVKYVA